MTKDGVSLSRRELEVLRLSAEGLGFTSIGTKLGISRTSVQTIRQNIKTKFGLLPGTELDEMLSEGRRRGFIHH